MEHLTSTAATGVVAVVAIAGTKWSAQRLWSWYEVTVTIFGIGEKVAATAILWAQHNTARAEIME